MLAILLGAGLFFAYPVAKLLLGAKKQGFFDPVEEQKYAASTTANLSALYKGLKLYHDSEAHFPKASEWMDAIKNRVQAGNMSEDEAAKKFIDPSLASKPGAYGYAMNDAASEKYVDDLKDKDAILIFTSQQTHRNAHGDPKKDKANPPRRGGNLGITIQGKIVKL